MTYFNLFSNILVTKGASRILISDLQRNTSDLYPLELHEVIEGLKNQSIENILKVYDAESRLFIREYIDMLLKKEYGFMTDGDWDKNFPPLSYTFYEPHEISNVFIEINDIAVLDKIKQSVENLGVKHLVIYCHNKLSLKEFQDIDDQFKGSVLNGIEIFSPFHDDVNENFISSLHQTLNRIYSLVFHSCPKFPVKSKDIFRFSLQFSRENLKISSCGKVDLKYFNTNLPKVSEALNYNSCLHKKIGIDRNGNIKNCPLMADHFGNINDSTLEEALMKPGFKKYWNITKDKIEVCKDCEFRYICTDCRAYTEQTHQDNNGSDLSKPLKCGYDPYTGKWEAWSKNPLKQQALHFYTQQLKI
ncbi:SPASM domain peptide maturase, grasp-with-spasm system [Chryseobacterium carnipullorum]|uniref:grasp-with-spasm system SPASM domain peptide maturase n=1 Tax=Chryseobacterium carnipullorum TaxID=1124835 RepID=UPI000922743D|nr:grasp-with-spasm system SPASM domain peptide maturase [Chryseobacterium carnipullorum]SHM11564.1 SPASM domain peptide maturase, grasp-with-spasm system [Chryseobacterium carnipullorum]